MQHENWSQLIFGVTLETTLLEKRQQTFILVEIKIGSEANEDSTNELIEAVSVAEWA